MLSLEIPLYDNLILLSTKLTPFIKKHPTPYQAIASFYKRTFRVFNDVQYKKYEHLPRMLISYISSLAAFPHRVGLIISVLLFDQTYPFYLLF